MKRILTCIAALLMITVLMTGMAFADGAADNVIFRTDVVALREEWEPEDQPCTSEVITFEIVDEANAILTDRMIESDSFYTDTVRFGTYRLTELGYEFLSPEPYGMDQWYSCVVVPDKATPGRIEGITYEYLDYSLKALTGTYKGQSEPFGEADLDVDETGRATLVTKEGRTVSGMLSAYRDGYDFFANIGDGQEEAYEDYYIEFSGDTYSLNRFSDVMYGPYAGTFSATGDLGEMTFTVEATYGTIETDAVIDGEKVHFTGTVYIDEESNALTGCYMYAENGMDMNLGFEDLSDGVRNYFGTFSKPLAAG